MGSEERIFCLGVVSFRNSPLRGSFTLTGNAAAMIEVFGGLLHCYFSGPFEIQYPPHRESLAMIVGAVDAAAAAGIPVAAVLHSAGEGAPVFAPGTLEFELHPDIERRRTDAWKGVIKQYVSVYAATDLAGWLRQHGIDAGTLVGYMTSNCILASAVEADFLGFNTEVLSDATGVINLANDAGFVDAKTVHTTVLTLLNSKWAAVSTTDAWADALEAQQGSEKERSWKLGNSRGRTPDPGITGCLGSSTGGTENPANAGHRPPSCNLLTAWCFCHAPAKTRQSLPAI